jgi:hypothetical protein
LLVVGPGPLVRATPWRVGARCYDARIAVFSPKFRIPLHYNVALRLRSNAMSTVVELINSEADPSGTLRLKYGTKADDPAPFVLTLTPSYVANEMQQILPIPPQDVVDYARRNKERLRTIAQVAKQRGLNAQVLE